MVLVGVSCPRFLFTSVPRGQESYHQGAASTKRGSSPNPASFTRS